MSEPDASELPYIVLGYLRGLIDYLRHQEAGVDEVLAVLGLTETDLRDPDRHVRHALQNELFDAAERVTGDANIGLHAGEATHLIHFGILGQLAMTCKTGRELVDLHTRYQRLISTGAGIMYFEEAGQLVGEAVINDPVLPSRHAFEYTLASHLSLTRLMAGGLPVTCSRIEVMYLEPEDTSEQQRFFNCPITYGSTRMRTYVPAMLLDLPLVVGDSASRNALESEARRRLEALRVPVRDADPELERLKRFVVDRLREGAPSLQDAARALNTSERTLQRRLEARELSYRDLIDAVRREAVTPLLRDADMSLVDVAFMLGFSDQSAFHRAFRRWFGVTPGEHRAALFAAGPGR